MDVDWVIFQSQSDFLEKMVTDMMLKSLFVLNDQLHTVNMAINEKSAINGPIISEAPDSVDQVINKMNE